MRHDVGEVPYRPVGELHLVHHIRHHTRIAWVETVEDDGIAGVDDREADRAIRAAVLRVDETNLDILRTHSVLELQDVRDGGITDESGFDEIMPVSSAEQCVVGGTVATHAVDLIVARASVVDPDTPRSAAARNDVVASPTVNGEVVIERLEHVRPIAAIDHTAIAISGIDQIGVAAGERVAEVVAVLEVGHATVVFVTEDVRRRVRRRRMHDVAVYRVAAAVVANDQRTGDACRVHRDRSCGEGDDALESL